MNVQGKGTFFFHHLDFKLTLSWNIQTSNYADEIQKLVWCKLMLPFVQQNIKYFMTPRSNWMYIDNIVENYFCLFYAVHSHCQEAFAISSLFIMEIKLKYNTKYIF